MVIPASPEILINSRRFCFMCRYLNCLMAFMDRKCVRDGCTIFHCSSDDPLLVTSDVMFQLLNNIFLFVNDMSHDISDGDKANQFIVVKYW